jgi:cytochrome c
MTRAWIRTAAGVMLVVSTGATWAADAPPGASAERGKRLYLQCVACHDLKPGGPLKVGPNLYGVFGRKAGTVPGLVVSVPLKDSGIIWTVEVLDKWLEKPSTVVPGTIMAFAGVVKPEDRASLIAYMQRECGPSSGAP